MKSINFACSVACAVHSFSAFGQQTASNSNQSTAAAIADSTSSTQGEKTLSAIQSPSGGLEVSYLGSFSYENLQSSQKDSAPFAGYEISTEAKVSNGEYFGFKPFLQPSLNWTSFGSLVTYRPLPGLTQEVTTDVVAALVGLDFGAEFKPLNQVNVDLVAGYRTKFYGTSKTIDKTGSIEQSKDAKVEKLDWVSLAMRGLYNIGPDLNLGAEIGYKGAGKLKFKDAKEDKFAGYSVGLVGAFQF